MALSKFKTFCRIQDYVESIDSDLGELLQGTCTNISLGSTKGKPGITFLMPHDALKKKISALAFSEKVLDANKASEMLNALIIMDVFKTPADWIAKKDDIPNSLFPSQRVEIESVSGKEVIFKGGARAVLDEAFKDASRKSNLAVWKLISGEIPVTTDKNATFKYSKLARKKNTVTGGYDVTPSMTSQLRYKIAIAVENSYVLNHLQRCSGDKTAIARDIYYENTMSLINFILNIRGDSATITEKVLPLISLDKIDFYLLVEPHKFGGAYLLDDELINDWWNQKGEINAPALRSQLESLLQSSTGAQIYTDRPKLLDRINDLRCKLGQNMQNKPRMCIDDMAKYYEELERNNTIGGSGPVYPPALAAYYAAEPGLKMIHDELRYLTYGAFKSLELDSSFDNGRFNELINMIGDCLFATDADSRARQQKLLNKNTIKYLISPTEKLSEIRTFLYSTMFMYVPITEAEATNFTYKNTVTRPRPDNIVVFNISKDLYNQHPRIAFGKDSSSSVLDLLRSMNPAGLDPAVREELQRLLNA